jgi:murein DD-endopeptidase MepM/ murein hydrolase activator NlpD
MAAAVAAAHLGLIALARASDATDRNGVVPAQADAAWPRQPAEGDRTGTDDAPPSRFRWAPHLFDGPAGPARLASLDEIIIPPLPRLAQRPQRTPVPLAPTVFEDDTPRLIAGPSLVLFRPNRSPGPLSPAFIVPIANGRITSMFNRGRYHPAIDLAGELGSPVFASTARQKVIFAGWRGGYGNAVLAKDDQGRTHLYGHLQSITVKVGDVLDQRQQLGHLGSTGFSTGPHVHYEITSEDGRPVNPVALLFPGLDVAAGYRWTAPDAVLLTAASRRPN